MELRFNLKDRNTETLLFACCFFDKKRIKVSTGKRIFSETWNVSMQRCEVSNKFSDRTNRRSRKVNKFLDKLCEEWKSDISLNDPREKSGYYGSADYVKYYLAYLIRRIDKKEEELQAKLNITPIQFFEKYVEEMTHKVDPRLGKLVSGSTQEHHRCVLNRIKEFMRQECIKDDFKVFDKWFSEKFINWGYTSKKYRQNTIPATFSVLKVWLNAAKAQSLFNDEAYKAYPSKGTDVDNIYLTKQEIERIYRLDIGALKKRGEIDAKSQIESTRDLFIVGCWTGLRRSDLSNLHKALFDLERNKITIITEKTSEEIIIPMHPFVKEIYQKYAGKFPKLGDKSNVNRHLQEIGRHANIDESVIIKENKGGKIFSNKYKKYELIKMHTARRSFATNMYLAGAPTISIMKLTGHTTEKNFLKYIKITKEENAQAMMQYFT